MEKAIYKLLISIPRHGTISGIFVIEKKYMKKLLEEKIEIYLGEVLGKHSEVYVTVEEDEIVEITDDVTVVEIFENYNLYSGINPFEYVSNDFFEE